MATVVVTGASGYIAGHVIEQLLAKGYRVKGSVRSLADDTKVGTVANYSAGPPLGATIGRGTAPCSCMWFTSELSTWCDCVTQVKHLRDSFPGVELFEVSGLSSFGAGSFANTLDHALIRHTRGGRVSDSIAPQYIPL